MHDDICGPMTPSTPSGNKYFLRLVDDLSRYMWISLTSSKDTLALFVAFKSQTEAESRRKLGTLCTDRGGEFTVCSFIEHCTEEGIRCHMTTPHTPEQNGVVERHNQHGHGTQYAQGNGDVGVVVGCGSGKNSLRAQPIAYSERQQSNTLRGMA
jgi:transposase InsO family protein